MTKMGFNTGNGFHDDVEQFREEVLNVREQVNNIQGAVNDLSEKVNSVREGLLKVEYDITGAKYGEAVELELPEGYTTSDIFGIEFMGGTIWMSCFGRGSFNGDSRTCVGFKISQATGDYAGTLGLSAEIAGVGITAVGTSKFNFTIESHYYYFSVPGQVTRRHEEGSVAINANRTLYVYFSKGVLE